MIPDQQKKVVTFFPKICEFNNCKSEEMKTSPLIRTCGKICLMQTTSLLKGFGAVMTTHDNQST